MTMRQPRTTAGTGRARVVSRPERPIQARGPHRQTRRERGFVAVTTAIVMMLFVLFAALAIDTAIWFARAAQLQRAADAAALAGVTKMPNLAAADTLAKKAAKDNRIDNSKVTVEKIPDVPRQLRVKVTDTVPSFFGRFLRNSTTVTRTATAEYLPKIELGSKLNAVGTGDDTAYSAPLQPGQGFWLAINGYCTPKEDGDRFASAFEANRTAAGEISCDAAAAPRTTNTDFPGLDLVQYSYIVDVPCPDASDPCTATTVNPFDIEIMDPYFDRTNDGIDTNIVDPTVHPEIFDVASVTTNFKIRTLQDDLPIAAAGPITNADTAFPTCGYPDTDCAALANHTWHTLFRIPIGSAAGKYRVAVNTTSNEANSYGSNAFALGVFENTGAPHAYCSGAFCPTIAGEASMSVYANIAGVSDFYLAKLAPARNYRGKRIRILLWDPGERADSIKILKPTPAAAPGDFIPTAFNYRTWYPGLASHPSDPMTPITNALSLDVSGTASALPSGGVPAAPWPATERANDYRFNGRLVSLELTIPTNYGCASSTPPCVDVPLAQGGWWKIRYTAGGGGAPFDRTTWTVQIVGDPVHLVNG